VGRARHIYESDLPSYDGGEAWMSCAGVDRTMGKAARRHIAEAAFLFLPEAEAAVEVE
jgi:hypothetical protein